MGHQRSPWIRRMPAATALLMAASQFVAGDVVGKSKNIHGTTVEYKVILPDRYDSAKAYPGVLAFPGGSQTMDIVDGMVERNFRTEAQRRGYIVVIPAAPRGVLFFEGSERVFPEFLDKISSDYKIQDGKFHIAGISNGGISAFHIAASHPQYFLSVTGFPGYLIDPTPARVNALSKMCINMHVGELDSGWQEDMDAQAKQFRAKGYTVRFTVEKGEGHVMRTLAGAGSARLFNQFDEARQGCAK
jgi:poly(3-hydroxybutyrate) depolymerase